MRRMSDSLRVRIEQYYATVPLLFADAEEFGPLRLFVRKEPGTPYYGGPSHAQPTAESAGSVTTADIARVRARQCELGVPEAFEWLAEAAPALRARIEAVGLPVAERPLMALDPHLPIAPQPLPDGVTIRVLTADDPALPAVLALPRLAFAAEGTAVGAAGRAELSAAAEEVPRTAQSRAPARLSAPGTRHSSLLSHRTAPRSPSATTTQPTAPPRSVASAPSPPLAARVWPQLSRRPWPPTPATTECKQSFSPMRRRMSLVSTTAWASALPMSPC